MKNRPIKYNQPISTADGLREAIRDVLIDECGETFTAAWLQTRLPYGSRVRRILGEMVHDGTLHRVGYGIYQKAGH